VAREVFKVENIVNFTVQPDFFERFSKRIGAQISSLLVAQNTTLQLR